MTYKSINIGGQLYGIYDMVRYKQYSKQNMEDKKIKAK